MAFFHLCGLYGLKWSYGLILQSPLWSFASLLSLLPLWLMPSLSGLWVLVGGRLLADLLGCHIVSNFNNWFNGALRDVPSFGYFIITQPWSVLLQNLSLTCLERSLVFMVPLAWWCPLLSGVADSGAFQNRCIYWDHVTNQVTTSIAHRWTLFN